MAAWKWSGTEARQHYERMRACRSRRRKYGQGSCAEKDGSCTECEIDMKWALRIARAAFSGEQ